MREWKPAVNSSCWRAFFVSYSKISRDPAELKRLVCWKTLSAVLTCKVGPAWGDLIVDSIWVGECSLGKGLHEQQDLLPTLIWLFFSSCCISPNIHPTSSKNWLQLCFVQGFHRWHLSILGKHQWAGRTSWFWCLRITMHISSLFMKDKLLLAPYSLQYSNFFHVLQIAFL